MIKIKRLQSNVFYIIIIFAIILVFFICTHFVIYMDKTTEKELDRYLSELSASVVYSVDARLNSNLDTLASIATNYVEQTSYGLEDLTNLKKQAEKFKFNHVYVMTLDGQAKGFDGTSFDFSQYANIMQVCNGQRLITDNIFPYSTSKHGFAYAVPMYQDNNIVGAIIANNTTEWIINLLSQNYFDGDGFFHIVDRDGNFIIKSNNPKSRITSDNFYTSIKQEMNVVDAINIENIQDDLSKKGSASFSFSLKNDDVKKISKLFPLNHEGYTLVLMVTEDAARRQFDLLETNGIHTNIFIASTLIGMLIFIFLIFRRQNKKLSILAFVDPVTNGYSQTRFEMEAMKKIQNAENNTYAFVSINVLKFKLINDMYGTEEGNRVLYYIHHIFCKHLLKEELTCRSFADHFDVLITTREQHNLIQKLEKVTKEMNAFNDNRSNKYYLNLSVGVYPISDRYLSIMNIRDRANVARKDEHNAIHGRFYACSFYSDLERQKQQREKEMENRMDDALENHEFVVYFQPKIRLTDNKIVGAEALVRWYDRQQGLIPPDEFIPFFERNGFIVQLDLYVFEQACRVLRNWLDANVTPIAISANLSRVHLNDPDFLEPFIAIQEKYAIPPSLLEIELTETLLFENLQAVVKAIDAIHSAGFYCSLDDFGSGYSSLNMLQDIHVDYLKLDKAFFRSPNLNNHSERAIIESVVGMAKKLSMTVIFEGIETQEQLAFLREINCGIVQGFIISKPVPLHDFETILFGKDQASRD